MAVKIAYLLLVLAATFSSLQNAEADDRLIRKAEGITVPQDVVHKPPIKSVPLFRSRRSSAFNQIHANPAPGFRMNMRRSGSPGQFSQDGSSRQNGFVNQGYPGVFNNAEPFVGANVPVGFIGPDDQGYFVVIFGPSGFGNPANSGGFKNTQGGFRNTQAGFRNVQGGYRNLQGGFRDPVNSGGFRNSQGGFRNSNNPVGSTPEGGFRSSVNPSGFMSGGFRNTVNPSEDAPGFNQPS